MKSPKKPVDVLIWKHKGFVVTARVYLSGDGYLSEWLISSNFESNLQVLGFYQIPVWGNTFEEASRKVSSLVESVSEFAYVTCSGLGSVDLTRLSAADRENYALAHMIGHYEDLSEYDLLARTEALVALAGEFSVKDVAKVVAELEEESVRTIHDRIYRAKRR
jgi:hypothetical protein